MLEKSQQDPRIRTAAAASALVAGGALAAAKVVHDRVEERRREKAGAFRFDREETPRDGVGRIARSQLDLTIELLQDAHSSDDGGEAVHEARKALKRLRTLIRLSQGVSDDKRFRRENVILRDVGRALSDTRDVQVLLDTLDGLIARYAEQLRQGTWSRLREALAAATAQPPVIEIAAGGSLVEVLSDARERVVTWPLPQDAGPTALADGFERVYRRGRRALRAARSTPSPETLHELRKRAKDLWHTAQLLESVCPEPMDQLKREAHRLSDLLGEDHDLTILREHACRQPELLTPVELELLIALTKQRQLALRLEAMQCAASLYREKPKDLLPRLALA